MNDRKFKIGDQFKIAMYCIACRDDVETLATVAGISDAGVLQLRYAHAERHHNVHAGCPACGGARCRVYSTEDQANSAADHEVLAASGYVPPADEPWSTGQ